MDQGIKKALPQSGTKAFPRAPLPSTNFQTSDNLCRSLEHYLEALLREPRYAACEPVARFFEKERTDSKAGVVNPLVFLGQGVNNIGKGVTEVGKGIGRSGEMATRSIATGFNQFTNTITTGIPGLKRTSSGQMEGTTPGTPTKMGKTNEDTPPLARRSSADSLSASGPSGSRQNLTSPSTASLATSISSVKEEAEDNAQERKDVKSQPEDGNAVMTVKTTQQDIAEPVNDQKAAIPAPPPLPPRPNSPGGYEVPDTPVPTSQLTPILQDQQKVLPEAVQPQVVEFQPETPAGFAYTPRKKTIPQDQPPSETPYGGESTPAELQAMSHVETGGRMSFDELLEKDRELQKKMAEKEAARDAAGSSDIPSASIEKSASGQGQSKKSAASTQKAQSVQTAGIPPAQLSAIEFSSVLSFAMAILEEAYELSDGAWNLRRGILRVLETVLRTSYAGVIRAAMAKLVQSVSEEGFYVSQIDKLRESFWPPPDNV